MKILVRRSPGNPDGLRWARADGWAWRCPCCDTGGRASWWSHRRGGSAKVSPFERAIASVDRHLRDRHGLDHARYMVTGPKETA